MARPGRRTFFVESYVPAVDERAAASLSSRLRAAVDELRREGHEIEWLSSFALLEEETYVCMLTAADEREIGFVHERARIPCEHVVEAVPLDAPDA